ncbi:uncharacterized protein ATC70_002199 [Mucor velutinosus]|uniref:RanBP-type and C3HC4-type zinc finger-containing protein 1 n=1 Tax=Mucor velutinosus TaxID=708070 RepID=A0AAN7DEW5_9FUNG|nr:hypothetical protein ATC70_002199 [Mucor velutinosus]
MEEHTLNIESHLMCSICSSEFLQTTNIAECGHRFCFKCIQESLKESSTCPKCLQPVEIKNLTADSKLDKVVAYMDLLKNELLTHPLTPTSLSLQQQQHQMSRHLQVTSNSDETAEEYQLEETSSDLIPSAEELEKSFNRKRKLSGMNTENTDTQTTANDEDDLEREFNDSLSASAIHEAKRLKPSESDSNSQRSLLLKSTTTEDTNMAERKPKITDDEEKKRLLNPENMLGDIWSFPQDDDHTAQSQSQRNESSAMASASGNSESEATQTEQQSATDESALADEPMSQSKQSAESKEVSKDFIPDTVYSDSEDSADTKDMWKCSECQFTNQLYIQACVMCHAFRNRNTNGVLLSAEASQESASIDKAASPALPKEPYKMTVASDEENGPIDSTFTVPKTRRRDSSTSRKEVHIIYTGLTPEDEKRLDKIKEEADLTLKIVIHYQMRDFDDVTHVITSVDKKHLCKRTLKYLQGVLKGKWIVDPQWVIDSTKSKKWQAEDKYEVQGDHLTGKTYAPKLAREPQQEPLFQDMKFYLFGDFSGKHNKNDLLILCKAGGAKILSRKPPGHVANKQTLNPAQPVVIYSADHQKKKRPVWLNQCQVRDPQWIIDCISKFKVEY